MRAFVFPGQGSQKVGMGVDLAAASTGATINVAPQPHDRP